MTVVDAVDAFAGAFRRPAAERMMRAGSILPDRRAPDEMLVELVRRVAGVDRRWGTAGETSDLVDGFAADVERGRVIVGSPALTNIWHPDRPLGSCTAVACDGSGLDSIFRAAGASYRMNMGAGYRLDRARDPVAALLALNDHAARVESSGACERYVGNMATLAWNHPKVHPFIDAKISRSMPHFNISVNFDAEGELAWRHGDRQAREVMDHLGSSAWCCGDPGLVLLDRYQQKNPLANRSQFTTTAPCAEVGLAPATPACSATSASPLTSPPAAASTMSSWRRPPVASPESWTTWSKRPARTCQAPPARSPGTNAGSGSRSAGTPIFWS
jgi:ribonucleoside-diphosphate reductase alpha chain